MILSVGEILIDRIVKSDGEVSHVGGAPFNVAVNAYRHGNKTAFFGKVGEDKDGEFIKKEGAKYLPENLFLSTDKRRKTTVAMVTLIDGERNFKFLRDDAADYNLTADDVNFDFTGLNIVHLGTLMLNTKEGRSFAEYVVSECKRRKIRLSVDANFRDDLFESKEERNEVFLPFLKAADIVKFSDDELEELTGKDTVEEGIKAFCPKEYIFVTCGKKGSAAYKKGIGYVRCEATPAEKVVDTTGAGDAYYGTVLAGLDRLFVEDKPIDETTLRKIMSDGNVAGKEATQKEGAV